MPQQGGGGTLKAYENVQGGIEAKFTYTIKIANSVDDFSPHISMI